jgi:hypothetical protein
LNSLLQKGISPPVNKVKIPEHTNLSAEQRDKNTGNDSYMSLRCGGPVQTELNEEDPAVGVISTLYNSDRKENIDESKMFDVSISSRIEGRYAVPLIKPGHYKLRSFNVQRQEDLTSHHIVPKPTGLVDMPEVVKLVGIVKETKKHGQPKESYLTVNCLDGGNAPNCSVAGIGSTVEPDTEFESTSSTQFISNVAIHCKEKVESKEPCGSSHHRIALYNTSPYTNTACIRPCHVKLVRLEDADKQARTIPVSTVHSHCFRNYLLKSSSSKLSGKLHKVSGAQCKCVVDEEGCRMLHTDSPDSEAERKQHITSIQQENTHFSSSVHRAEEMGVVSKSGTKQTCISVPAPDCFLRWRGDESKVNIVKNSGKKIVHLNMTSEQFSNNVICGNIDRIVGHVPVEAENGNELNYLTSQGRHVAPSKTGEKTNSEVTETSVLRTEFAEVINKTFCIQEKCGNNSVQIGHRKHLRKKIVKGKEHISKKLLKYKLPDQLSLLNKMKPVSISLERLSQSVLEKYSAASPIVSCRFLPRKGVESIQQETACTAENVESYSGAYWKHITRSGNVKYRDRIPCLDGVIETSSSDDSSESRSVDCFKQLEKSPVTEKTRRQEKLIHTFENKLTDLHHQDESVITPLQKPSFGTPSKNLNLMNTAASAQTCSPSGSARKALYPPLPIRIQKSPKKRTVNAEGKFQEKSSPMKHISFPSSRLSGEETRPYDVYAEHNFANVRSEDTSLDPSLHLTAVEVAVTHSSVCHDARTPENQLNICAEKHMYVVSRFSAHCSVRRL